MRRPIRKTAALAATITVAVVSGTRLGSRGESRPTHGAAKVDTSETTEAKIDRACLLGRAKSRGQRKSSIRMRRDTQWFYVKAPTTASRACQAIRTSSAILRCALTDHRCSGSLILQLINPSQRTLFPGSLTCWRVLLSVAIPIPMTESVRPITVGPHWMIMWPFDGKVTGLPTHRDMGAYICGPCPPGRARARYGAPRRKSLTTAKCLRS